MDQHKSVKFIKAIFILPPLLVHLASQTGDLRAAARASEGPRGALALSERQLPGRPRREPPVPARGSTGRPRADRSAALRRAEAAPDALSEGIPERAHAEPGLAPGRAAVDAAAATGTGAHAAVASRAAAAVFARPSGSFRDPAGAESSRGFVPALARPAEPPAEAGRAVPEAPEADLLRYSSSFPSGGPAAAQPASCRRRQPAEPQLRRGHLQHRHHQEPDGRAVAALRPVSPRRAGERAAPDFRSVGGVALAGVLLPLVRERCCGDSSHV